MSLLRAAHGALFPVVLGLVDACGGGQRAATGETEALRVEGGTFIREPLPEDDNGPSVRATNLSTRVFPERTQDKSFSGVLDEEGRAVAIALSDDLDRDGLGYWLVAAGPPLPDAPGLPSFDAPLSFSSQLLPGAYELLVVAVDSKGRGGETRHVGFQLSERPRPEGELVFSLDWDRNADLDLHVVTPNGTEIYESNVREGNSTGPASASDLGGRIDFDSNGDCRIDGRRNENVIFTSTPPSGRYVVRVDTFSLCGEALTRWRVTAFHQGQLVGTTSGASLPIDTRGDHGRGSGVTALELVVR